MYCKHCGTRLDENNICPNCEYVQLENEEIEESKNFNEDRKDNYPSKDRKFSGKAITGFVLSMVGILIAGVICGIIGIIFSAIALNEIDKKMQQGKGLALSGLIVSIIDIIFGFIGCVTIF